MNNEIPEIFFDRAEPNWNKQPTAAYGLAPYGAGQSNCESLFSYVLRLAMAHRVGPWHLLHSLIPKSIIFEPLRATFHSQRNLTSEYYAFLSGKRTVDLVAMLEEATGEHSLAHCTLLPLVGVVSNWRLSRNERMFCPMCVRRHPRNSQCETLASTIQCVRACPQHGVLLVRVGCGKPSTRGPFPLRPLVPGVCPDCGSIGHQCVMKAPKPASAVENWTARQLGELIASFGRGESLSNQATICALNEITIQRYGGKMAWFARAASIPKATMHLWVHGEMLPNIQQLLALCHAAELSLYCLLRGQLKKFEAPAGKAPMLHIKRRPLTPILDTIEATMRRELRAYPTKSLRKVAMQFGADAKSIQLRLPDLTGRLVRQAKVHRQEIAQKRRDELEASVISIGKLLLRRGEPLSRQRFERHLGVTVCSGSKVALAIKRFQGAHGS